MNSHFDDLTTVLENQVALHSDLLETAGALNCAIKENDIARVRKHTARYDEQVCRLEKLEEMRKECCARLTKSLGLPHSELRLASLIEYASAKVKQAISALQGALKQKINELAKINTANRIMLEDALAAINNTFESIRQSGDKFAQYRQKGTRAIPAQACSLINRTI